MRAEHEDAAMGALIIGWHACVFGLGCFIGYTSGWKSEAARYKREAIERGYAEYVTDENSLPAWKWRDEPAVRPESAQ